MLIKKEHFEAFLKVLNHEKDPLHTGTKAFFNDQELTNLISGPASGWLPKFAANCTLGGLMFIKKQVGGVHDGTKSTLTCFAPMRYDGEAGTPLKDGENLAFISPERGISVTSIKQEFFTKATAHIAVPKIDDLLSKDLKVLLGDEEETDEGTGAVIVPDTENLTVIQGLPLPIFLTKILVEHTNKSTKDQLLTAIAEANFLLEGEEDDAKAARFKDSIKPGLQTLFAMVKDGAKDTYSLNLTSFLSNDDLVMLDTEPDETIRKNVEDCVKLLLNRIAVVEAPKEESEMFKALKLQHDRTAELIIAGQERNNDDKTWKKNLDDEQQLQLLRLGLVKDGSLPSDPPSRYVKLRKAPSREAKSIILRAIGSSLTVKISPVLSNNIHACHLEAVAGDPKQHISFYQCEGSTEPDSNWDVELGAAFDRVAKNKAQDGDIKKLKEGKLSVAATRDGFRKQVQNYRRIIELLSRNDTDPQTPLPQALEEIEKLLDGTPECPVNQVNFDADPKLRSHVANVIEIFSQEYIKSLSAAHTEDIKWSALDKMVTTVRDMLGSNAISPLSMGPVGQAASSPNKRKEGETPAGDHTPEDNKRQKQGGAKTNSDLTDAEKQQYAREINFQELGKLIVKARDNPSLLNGIPKVDNCQLCLNWHLRGKCNQGGRCARAASHKKIDAALKAKLLQWAKSKAANEQA